MGDLGPCVCTSIRKAGRAVLRYYDAAVAGTGVSITQYSVLRAIERAGAAPLSRLAEELVLERTSLYRTIRPLIDGGAVSVRTGESGRAKIAELTDRGRNLIVTVMPLWEEAQRKAVAAIGEKEWARLSALLLEIPDRLKLTI